MTLTLQKIHSKEEEKAFINNYDDNQLSVHSQVWMILGGVVTGKAAEQALQTALNSAAAVQPVTPYMHHYLVESMLYSDLKEDALTHIKSYWGGMISHGADTFWEVYVPNNAEISPYNDPLVHSFCHAWSCSPSYFIRKYFI